MVKSGWTVFKISICSTFGLNSPMEFGTFDFMNLGRPIKHETVDIARIP